MSDYYNVHMSNNDDDTTTHHDFYVRNNDDYNRLLEMALSLRTDRSEYHVMLSKDESGIHTSKRINLKDRRAYDAFFDVAVAMRRGNGR